VNAETIAGEVFVRRPGVMRIGGRRDGKTGRRHETTCMPVSVLRAFLEERSQ
jgi:hypothetical protein